MLAPFRRLVMPHEGVLPDVHSKVVPERCLVDLRPIPVAVLWFDSTLTTRADCDWRPLDPIVAVRGAPWTIHSRHRAKVQ